MGEKQHFHAESNIAEILAKGPAMEAAFRAIGLKCVDCVASEKETLRDAARFHEIPIEKILSTLNQQTP